MHFISESQNDFDLKGPMEVIWFNSLPKAGPLLKLDLTLNLDKGTEGNMYSSFEYFQRIIIPQPAWATCAVFDFP